MQLLSHGQWWSKRCTSKPRALAQALAMHRSRARSERAQRSNRMNNSCMSRAGVCVCALACTFRRRRRRRRRKKSRRGAAYVDAVVAHGAVRGARRPVEVARRAPLHAHRDAAHLDRAVHGRRARLPALLHRVHRLRVALRCAQSAPHWLSIHSAITEFTGKHTCLPALHSIQVSPRQ